MQWFVVKYRKPDGAMAEAEFEAADKSALFKLLAEKKISAINIQPGRRNNKQSRGASGIGAWSYKVVALIAGFIVVVAVVYIVALRGGHDVGQPKDGLTNVTTDGSFRGAKRDQRQSASGPAFKKGLSDGEIKESSTSNRAATELLSDIPGTDNMPVVPSVKQEFDNPSDQIISMVLNGSGEEIAPVPFTDTMDEDFKKAILKPIVINEDDSAEVKEVKQRVIQAREDIKALLKEGMTVRQILEEHRETVNYNAEVRREAILEARKIFDSGDVDGANMYVAAMNNAFSQMGIDKIEFPKTKEERRAEIIERINERKASEAEVVKK